MSGATAHIPNDSASGLSAVPDWTVISEEIHCPLCEYNLRGLVNPRCPECGFCFDWDELLIIEKRVHPYLFEHHPEGSAWSLVMTILGGMRPWRFWRSLHPAQSCRPKRLAIYAILLLIPAFLVWISILGSVVADRWEQNKKQRNWERAYLSTAPNASAYKSELDRYGGLDAYLDLYYPVSVLGVIRQFGPLGASMFRFAVPSILLVSWPVCTFAALCIFEISRRRIRIGRIHVIRAVVYCSDVVWGIGLLAVFLLAGSIIATHFGVQATLMGRQFDLQMISLFVALVAVLTFAIRLVFAYRRYLRFPHAVWVVISSQAIAGLIVFKLVLELPSP